ncbi:MAG: response regulator [Gammaproteobacteria bacterium]
MKHREAAAGKESSGPQPLTILAVEDDAVTRRVIKAIFERNGHIVETAGNAEEALQFLQQSVPSLLILDVVMPGVSGYELCRTIKQDDRLRHIPVVFLTGQNQPQNYKEGHDSGATMYIPKPVKEDSLLRVARMLLPHFTPLEKLAKGRGQCGS